MNISRRQFLGTLAVAGAGAVVPTAVDVWRCSIEVSRRVLRVGKGAEPRLRLAHLSDLHYSGDVPLTHIERAVELALAERPHVVCLTGDFVTDHAPDPAEYVRVLRRLSGAAPTFASLGNHDGGVWAARRGLASSPAVVVDILTAAGVRVLRNECETVTVDGRQWVLAGVEDLWSFPIDINRAGLSQTARGAERPPRIVLSHNPDSKDLLAAGDWDLLLCGHTHGGQIRLPFIGGRLTAPVRDTRFVEGLRGWEGRWIHVTRGVGAIWGLRVNCPAEVAILELS